MPRGDTLITFNSANMKKFPFFSRYFGVSLGSMWRQVILVLIALPGLVSTLCGQSPAPAAAVTPPKAIFTPAPVYRPEWAKQKLAGKGVVLLNIDKATGNVTGAKMLESTGNNLLDGAALEAYSKWRFQPGGNVTQLKMPIEFRSGPAPAAQRPGQPSSQPSMLWIIVVFVLGAATMAMLRRRKTD